MFVGDDLFDDFRGRLVLDNGRSSGNVRVGLNDDVGHRAQHWGESLRADG